MEVEHLTDDCTCQGKRCKDCEKVKCFRHFYTRDKNRSADDLFNLYPRCKECHSKRVSVIRERWNKANPEKVSEHQNRYRQSHPDIVDKSPEAIEYRRQYAKWHYENLKVTNPQAYKTKLHKAGKNRRTIRRLAEGSHTLEEWKTLKAKYNYTCLRCGKSEPSIVLTEDHVVPLFMSGSDYISNIQPLCRSCNSSNGVSIIDYRVHYRAAQ
jgi:hypothetical protein